MPKGSETKGASAAWWCLLLALTACSAAPPAATPARASRRAAPAPPAGCCAAIDRCVQQLSEAHQPGSVAIARSLDADQHAWSEALAECGPPAGPAVVGLVDHPSQWVTDTAAAALGKIKEPRPQTVPALLRLLARDPRGWAGWALNAIGDRQAIPALVRLQHGLTRRDFIAQNRDLVELEVQRLLDDPNAIAETKRASLALLPPSSFAAPALQASLKRFLEATVRDDTNPYESSSPPGDEACQRRPAGEESPLDALLEAIAPLGDSARPLAPQVRGLLAHHRALTRWQARHTFASIAGAEALPLLLASLAHHQDTECLDDAARRLGALGEEARSASRPLQDALSAAPPGAHGALVWALGQLRDPGALPALGAQLACRQPATCVAAAEAIGPFGTQAFPYLPDLERVARSHWSARVRTTAAAALRAITGRTLAPGREHLAPGLRVEATGPDAVGASVVGAAGATRLSGRAPLPAPPLVGSCAGLTEGGASLDVNGECLVGVDRGEWGGGIYTRQAGASRLNTLLEGTNIVALLPERDGAWAVAREPQRRGWLGKLARGAQGWSLTSRVELPGAPEQWARLPDERLVVLVTGDGGAVRLPRECEGHYWRAFLVASDGALQAIESAHEECAPDVDIRDFSTPP